MPTLTGCSVCLKRALAVAKSFSRGSASIAIAAEFFWVSVMVVFMVPCGWQKIYTVLQRTSTSDLGAHYLLPARSTSGISPVSAWMVIGPHIHLESPASEQFGAIVQSVRGEGVWCSKQCGDLLGGPGVLRLQIGRGQERKMGGRRESRHLGEWRH